MVMIEMGAAVRLHPPEDTIWGRLPPTQRSSSRAEQFVDARLGARPGVDFLDDHRAIELAASFPRGEAAGDDDGAGGHASVGDLVGCTVIDSGALAYEDAHPEHRVFSDDDPFDDLRAGADEAIV